MNMQTLVSEELDGKQDEGVAETPRKGPCSALFALAPAEKYFAPAVSYWSSAVCGGHHTSSVCIVEYSAPHCSCT